jgi:hypothetical protein
MISQIAGGVPKLRLKLLPRNTWYRAEDSIVESMIASRLAGTQGPRLPVEPGGSLGRGYGVVEEHGDGHRADAAGDRGDE